MEREKTKGELIAEKLEKEAEIKRIKVNLIKLFIIPTQ